MLCNSEFVLCFFFYRPKSFHVYLFTLGGRNASLRSLISLPRTLIASRGWGSRREVRQMFRTDLGTSCSGEVSECVAWVSDSGPVAPHCCFLPLFLSPRDNERRRETETDRWAEMGREKRKIPSFYLLWGFRGGRACLPMQETQEMQVWSLGQDSLKEGMATHSSILAWRIPWTEEPGKLL